MWHGMCEKMDQHLEVCCAPMVLKFTSEQLQNPDEMAEYVKEKCCGSPREASSYATFWTLAPIYWLLLDTRHLRSKRRKSGQQPLWPFKLELNCRNSPC